MINADEELVSFTLALEEMAREDSDVGPRSLRFMLRQAAIHIKKLRPDLSFTTHPIGWMGDISGTPFGPSDR